MNSVPHTRSTVSCDFTSINRGSASLPDSSVQRPQLEQKLPLHGETRSQALSVIFSGLSFFPGIFPFEKMPLCKRDPTRDAV